MKRIAGKIVEGIRQDREGMGMTLDGLAVKYGVSKSSVSVMVRGCDASRVKRAAPGRRVVRKVSAKERPMLSKTDMGEAARQMVCARMMWNEVKVFRPITEDTPIDLLVLKKDGTVLKCQCKYIFPDASGKHMMNLYAVRKNGMGAKAVKHRYTAAEVDFFVGYCGDNDGVYVIPNADTNGVAVLAFWVLRDAVGGNGGGMDTSLYLNAFHHLK